ncbi:MAG: ROK family protein, partial [Blastocatellia bacterium]
MSTHVRSQVVGGVDIGGTKIAVGLVDSEGKVHARQDFPTDAEGGFGRAIRRVGDALRHLSQENKAEIRGIGIGSTGPVDALLGTFGNINFMPAWEGHDPVRVLEDEFNVQVALE